VVRTEARCLDETGSPASSTEDCIPNPGAERLQSWFSNDGIEWTLRVMKTLKVKNKSFLNSRSRCNLKITPGV
jgi:hypothetical protein